jgi:preprotein translocase subunit SecF
MRKPFDYIGKRKLFVCISAALLLVALVFNLIFGTEMDISFKGGTLIRYSYSGTVDENVATDVAKEVLGNDAQVQVETVNNTAVISVSLSEEISTEQQTKLDDQLTKTLKDNKITPFSSNTLKASNGRLFFVKCLVAVALAAGFLLLYVGLRFKKIGGLSAGAFALLALLHDLLIVYFTFVIFRIPLNDNFVAVMLTILGYSLNDTIVIYDRIRENRRKLDSKTPMDEIVNLSLNQSFTRTLNTAIATAIAVATVAVVAVVLQMNAIISFALPMLFGVISGFYSSVYLSAPLWAWWMGRKPATAKKKK